MFRKTWIHTSTSANLWFLLILSTNQEKFQRGKKKKKTRVNKLRHTVYIYTKQPTDSWTIKHSRPRRHYRKKPHGWGTGMSKWIQMKMFPIRWLKSGLNLRGGKKKVNGWKDKRASNHPMFHKSFWFEPNCWFDLPTAKDRGCCGGSWELGERNRFEWAARTKEKKNI